MEFFKNVLSKDQNFFNFTVLSGTIGPINMPDKTSRAAARRLQNAIKYYTKVRTTDAVGKELNNSATA